MLERLNRTGPMNKQLSDRNDIGFKLNRGEKKVKKSEEFAE